MPADFSNSSPTVAFCPNLGSAGRTGWKLWIGTEAGLAHLVNNRLILHLKNEGWLIANIFEDRDGKIRFRRNRPDDKTHSLCQVLDNRVRCYGSKDGVDVFAIGPIAQDPSGDLWVGGNTTFGGREHRKFTGRKRCNPTREMAASAALLPAADGSLWVGMALAIRGAGLQHMVDGILKPFFAPNLNGETLQVQALCSDRQNNLWVGTTRQGLYRIRGTEVDHYESFDGLTNDWVKNIFEDREGSLWVATLRGIDMFRDLRVKSISHREGLADGEVEIGGSFAGRQSLDGNEPSAGSWAPWSIFVRSGRKTTWKFKSPLFSRITPVDFGRE